MTCVCFTVEGKPPVKDCAKSLWSKDEVCERVKSLREAACKARKSAGIPENKVMKNITMIVSIFSNRKGRADLDNMIGGICDVLQGDKNDQSKTKPIFVEDDRDIIRIMASIEKISKPEEERYVVVLIEDLK